MCNTSPIRPEDMPVTIMDRYANPRRDRFLITIYPTGHLWTDTDVLNRFVDDMERISPKTTGTPPVAVSWLRIAARDGRNAILLTLVIVFTLLWIDFGRPWFALIAMTPLALGVFWMVEQLNIRWLWWWDFDVLWPVLLIVAGGVLLYRWFGERRS